MQLVKEKILTTKARQILFNSLMQGFSVKESAKTAKIGYEYARKVCSGSGRYGTTDVNINALVKQEMAIISQEAGNELVIDKARQLKEYDKLRETAEKDKQYAVSKGCLDSQSRIIGAFEADNIQSNSLAALLAAAGKKAIESQQMPVLDSPSDDKNGGKPGVLEDKT